ncbi:hypothetical protein CLOP_g3013 [Closterium sp. NIES-67]|nr:hypothetical protein CLOP_g3013 [Closterium sp. NIES-67]
MVVDSFSASNSSATTSRSSSSNMSSSVAPWWTTLEVGPPGTLLYRILFLDSQYRAFSPWHDIPLHVSEYPSTAAAPSAAAAAAASAHPPPSGLSFLCVTPRGTWATYEVAQDENFNPIRLAKRNAAPAHFAENCHWNMGVFTQTWADPAAANDHLSGLHYDARPLHVLDISRRAARPGDVYPVKPLAAFAVITLAAPGAATPAAAAATDAAAATATAAAAAGGADADAGGVVVGAPVCVSWNVVAVASDDPLAKELQDVADVSKKLPGVLEEIREWLRLCECKEAGDEARVFGFNDRALGRKYVDACITDCHAAWQRLHSSLQKPEPWLPRAQPPKVTTIEAFWAPYTGKYSEGACNADDSTPAAIPQSNPNAGAGGAASLSPLSAAADSLWETMPAESARSMLAQLRARKHLARPAFFNMRELLEMGDAGKSKGAGKASKSGGRSKGKSAMGSGRRDGGGVGGEGGGGTFGFLKKGHAHARGSDGGKAGGALPSPVAKPAPPVTVQAEPAAAVAAGAPGVGSAPAAAAATAVAAPAVVAVAAGTAVAAGAAAAAAAAVVSTADAGTAGAGEGASEAMAGAAATGGDAAAATAAAQTPAAAAAAAAAGAEGAVAAAAEAPAATVAGAAAATGLAPVVKSLGGVEEGEGRGSSLRGVPEGGAEGADAETEGNAAAEKREGGSADGGEQAQQQGGTDGAKAGAGEAERGRRKSEEGDKEREGEGRAGRWGEEAGEGAGEGKRAGEGEGE